MTLIGANGAGKSSSHSRLAGLVKLTSGSSSLKREHRGQRHHRNRQPRHHAGSRRTAIIPDLRAGKSPLSARICEKTIFTPDINWSMICFPRSRSALVRRVARSPAESSRCSVFVGRAPLEPPEAHDDGRAFAGVGSRDRSGYFHDHQRRSTKRGWTDLLIEQNANMALLDGGHRLRHGRPIASDVRPGKEIATTRSSRRITWNLFPQTTQKRAVA